MVEEYRVKTGTCVICHKKGQPIHHHHQDYGKPKETIAMCASCHKKTHMYLNGTVRMGSRPYRNPMARFARQNAT